MYSLVVSKRSRYEKGVLASRPASLQFESTAVIFFFKIFDSLTYRFFRSAEERADDLYWIVKRDAWCASAVVLATTSILQSTVVWVCIVSRSLVIHRTTCGAMTKTNFMIVHIVVVARTFRGHVLPLLPRPREWDPNFFVLDGRSQLKRTHSLHRPYVAAGVCI
jgi:hypothetical protein